MGFSQKEFFLEAVKTYERKLLAYAHRLTRNLAQAQDAVQDTFLQLWNADLQKVQENWPAWLFAVCRYRIIDAQRKNKRNTSLGEIAMSRLESKEPSAQEKLEELERDRYVVELLKDLPENQREVLQLKFQDGLSYKQIAEVTGLSVSHVGVLIHMAVTRVKDKVKKDGDHGRS